MIASERTFAVWIIAASILRSRNEKHRGSAFHCLSGLDRLRERFTAAYWEKRMRRPVGLQPFLERLFMRQRWIKPLCGVHPELDVRSDRGRLLYVKLSWRDVQAEMMTAVRAIRPRDRRLTWVSLFARSGTGSRH
jgi:hypothetical protein